jgi:Tol biopolymer transport system component
MIKKQNLVIDRRQFKQDYVGYLDRYRKHLYTLVPGDSIPTQLTWGDYDDSDPVEPDGKHIAFVSNRTEDPDANSNTDIWVVDANNPNKDKN